jgi:hypothetical protein
MWAEQWNILLALLHCIVADTYSFFNFKSAENEITFEGKCATKCYQTVLWPQFNLKEYRHYAHT